MQQGCQEETDSSTSGVCAQSSMGTGAGGAPVFRGRHLLLRRLLAGYLGQTESRHKAASLGVAMLSDLGLRPVPAH